MMRFARWTPMALLVASTAHAQCGDVYAGTWRNPPFGFDIFRNGVELQFTPGVFDAPDQTPIALDAAGNLYHAQTIDAQGTVRVYRNNATLHTYAPRGGPSWVYSGLALTVEDDGTFHVAFYTAADTVTVYRNGAAVEASYSGLVSFQGSPVGLTWDKAGGRLLASVRTASNEVVVFDASGTPISKYTASGVPLASNDQHWFSAVAVASNKVDVYRDALPFLSVTGAFSASSRFALAVDDLGDPFILAGSGGGQFVVVDKNGAILHTLPNTASGGGTGLAIHSSTPCTCYADCEGDGDLDIFDFLCFQGEFANQDPYADCEDDGDWDLFDFLCFQGKYANGCD